MGPALFEVRMEAALEAGQIKYQLSVDAWSIIEGLFVAPYMA